MLNTLPTTSLVQAHEIPIQTPIDPSLIDMNLGMNASQANSLEAQLAMLQAYQDELAGVSHYRDKSGREISFDDYWQARQFEAQPMFIMGKLIRETLVGFFQGTAELINNLNEKFTYSVELIKDLMYREDCLVVEKTTELSQRIEEALIVNKIEDILNTCRNGELLIQNHLKFNHELDKHFDFMLNKVKSALAKARANNKPLLVLVGETHDGLNSAYHEALLLMISRNIPSIKVVFTEAFESSSYQYPGLTIDVSEKLMAKNGLTQRYIDFANSEYCRHAFLKPPECQKYQQVAEEGDTTPLGMKKRNDVMADVMINSTRQDAIGIVGALHVQGIMEETTLPDHYEILPMFVDDMNYVIELLNMGLVKNEKTTQFLQSDSVLKMPQIDLKNVLVPISADSIVQSAEQAGFRHGLSHFRKT